MADKDGGPAFPLDAYKGLGPWHGMTLRDYYAAHAPVDVKMALVAWGDPKLAGPPSDDEGRAAFMAVWALLRYDYADAMLEERKR